jgi:hypothetical protein
MQKYMLPENIYIKIREFPGECPLCGLFALGNKNCTPCPLYKAGEGCGSENSAWERWRINYDLDTDSSRKAAAGRIVEIVEAWEPEASE